MCVHANCRYINQTRHIQPLCRSLVTAIGVEQYAIQSPTRHLQQPSFQKPTDQQTDTLECTCSATSRPPAAAGNIAVLCAPLHSSVAFATAYGESEPASLPVS